MNSKRLNPLLLLASFVGLLDTGYLTYSSKMNTEVVCILESECDVVLQSSYSHIGFIPLAILGFIFYLLVFAGVVYLKNSYSRTGHLLFTIFSGVGFLFSTWLVHVQINILNSICFYCMVSAGLTTLIFGGFLWAFLVGEKQLKDDLSGNVDIQGGLE